MDSTSTVFPVATTVHASCLHTLRNIPRVHVDFSPRFAGRAFLNAA